MKLEINNFKCHNHKTFDFRNGITLLNGNSGVGKSTILHAISWVIFGEPRQVTPLNNDKAKTSVKLIFDKYTIYRQKKPELLRLTENTTILENEDAQVRITALWGTYKVWEACCYLQQEMGHALMALTNSDKMELLSEISFSSDNPDFYSEKLEEQVSKIQTELTVEEQLYKSLNKYVDDSIASFPEYKTYTYSKSQLEEIKEMKKSKIEEKNVLDKELKNYYQSSGRKQMLEDMINKLNKNVPSIRESHILDSMQTELADMNAILSDIKIQDTFKKEIDILSKKIDELNVDPENISHSTIMSTEKLENEYTAEYKIVENMGIKYNKEDIQNAIDFYNNQLILKKNHNIWLNVKILRDNLERIPEAEIPDISLLNRKMIELENSKNVLICPSCGTYVRVSSGTLHKHELAPTNEKDIAEIKLKISHAKDIENKQRERCNLLRDLEKHKDIPIEEPEKCTFTNEMDIHRNIAMLSRIKVLSLPETSSKILKDKKKKYELLEELKIKGGSLKDVKNIDISSYNKLKSDVQKYQKELMDYMSYEKELTKSKHELSKIILDDNIPVKHEQIIQELEQYNTIIEYTDKSIFIREKLEELRNTEKKYLDLTNKISNMKRLKQILMELEAVTLTNTVESINTIIQELSEELFDESMSIKISMFKTAKSTKISKPNVNLEISYRNIKYDNINKMSGGERSRISLLILLAMSKMTMFPIMMIDESTAYLNADMREICIDQVRKICPSDKVVLFIQHEGCLGTFDTVIDI